MKRSLREGYESESGGYTDTLHINSTAVRTVNLLLLLGSKSVNIGGYRPASVV